MADERERRRRGGKGWLLVAFAAAALAILAGIIALAGWEVPGGALSTWALALLAASLIAVAMTRRPQTDVRPKDNEAATLAAIEALQNRLAVVETTLVEIERHGGAGVRNNVSELTAEIGLLGGLMKDLAEAVAAHDERLNEQPANAGPPAEAPLASLDSPGPKPPRAAPPVVEPGEQSLFAASDIAGGSDEHRPSPSRREASREITADGPRPPSERDLRRDEEILGSIEEDRIELYLQPIVTLPQRKPKLYEAFGRVRLDAFELLSPVEFLPVAERHGLAAALDERIVAKTLKVARHLKRSSEASVSCNISPIAVAQPEFLRVLLRLGESDAQTISRLIVELPQRAFRSLDAERSGALSSLVDKGVRVCMDGVQDLRLDPVMLADKGVRFVKIPASMLLGDGAAAGAEIHPADIAAMLARADIALIAEKVESEATVAELLDLDVPLAQGFLFAEPRPVRAEIFTVATPTAPQPVPPPPATQPPTPEVAPSGKRPFRAFLRRAGA